MKKTIVITGINGFLGSNLAKKFSSEYSILGIEYSTNNLFRIEGYPFKVYDSKSIDSIFKENTIDVIIHTATIYGRNNEKIPDIAQTNLIMPFDLLDLSIKNNVPVFINTDTVLDRFVSTYSLTKRQFQEWLFFRKDEIKVVNMKLEHFYGIGCSTTNFITSMIERLKNNELNIDLTAGEQKRGFIYFEDIIEAYEIVVRKLDSLSDKYNEFEVGTHELNTIKEVMLILKALTKSNTNLNLNIIS